MIAINLKRVWLCLCAEINQMLTQDGGAIVNTASAHVAAKHGVVG